MKEYAPGIPQKDKYHELPSIKEPTTWEFGIHDHAADRRGRHFDLRLGDPETSHAHSWAMLPKLPEPGESTIVIEQPTHTLQYMDWQGSIPKGTYGAGNVKLHQRHKTEIVNSRPGHISFNIYKGSGPEEYTLHRLGGTTWKLYNRTINRKEHPNIPIDKPDYKETTIEKALNSDETHLMSAKIDDAHNLFYFPKTEDRLRVLSYRPSKKAPGGIIEHTHKVSSLINKKVPKELSDTILRGGLYAIHPGTGEATPHQTLGGMLNSDVWKSRDKQKIHGELKPLIYDVERYKGKDMRNAPYKDKLEVLIKAKEHFPEFELPQMAYTSEEKHKLLNDIKEGRVPETKEGVVLWNLHEGKPAIKAKFKQDHDVYIRGFFPGEKRLAGKGVGGFYYSHTPDGPIAGKVGTGISDKERAHMHEHPHDYLGLVAKVSSQHKYDSDALRAPAYEGLHLDKNSQDKLDKILV